MAYEPLTDFFGNSDLTDDATYTPVGGLPSIIKVIFDSSDFAVPGIDMIGFEDAQISILCKTADVASAKRDDTFLVRSVTYYAVKVGPDIHGITKISLTLTK